MLQVAASQEAPGEPSQAAARGSPRGRQIPSADVQRAVSEPNSLTEPRAATLVTPGEPGPDPCTRGLAAYLSPVTP